MIRLIDFIVATMLSASGLGAFLLVLFGDKSFPVWEKLLVAAMSFWAAYRLFTL